MMTRISPSAPASRPALSWSWPSCGVIVSTDSWRNVSGSEPLARPQASICAVGLSQTAGGYPIFFAQSLAAQVTLLNRPFTCALTSAALPLACCQVEVPFGEVTSGAGVGVAAGVPEGAGAADADDAGVPDGVGVGLAFARAAVSRLTRRAHAAVRV